MFHKNQMLIKIAYGLLLVMIVVATSGCALIDRLQAWKQGSNETVVEAPIEEMPVYEEVFTGETKEIALYFSDLSGQYLMKEIREIPKVEGIARATMQELFVGPSVESGLLPTIPAGTQLLDINVRPDGICVVDISSELISNHPGGSINEELTVYSIVNTLTQFPSVQEVQILVDSQYEETIAGHMDISATMARNDEFIMNQ